MTPERKDGVRAGLPWRWAAVLILGAIAAAYSNSLTGPFVFDDTAVIRDNPDVRHLWPLWRVFAPAVSQGLTSSGRPLVALSLEINYAIGGNQVGGYHLFNLAVHMLAALALFGVVRQTLPRSDASASTRSLASRVEKRGDATAIHPEQATLPALAIALLWALHPIQTESVTYIVQRAESMMGLFYLLTLYCFIRGAEPSFDRLRRATDGGNPLRASPDENTAFRWRTLSCLACLCGMACKEAMASAPLIIFLYDRTFVSGSFREAWRRHRAVHIGLASTWLLLACELAIAGNRGATAGFGAGVAWWRYALDQAPAIVRYLRLSVWPHPLVFYYGRGLNVPPGRLALTLVIVGAMLAGSVWALRRKPELGFYGACFFLILAPSSSIVPVATEVMAEHRMYLPLAAGLLAAVFGLSAVIPSSWITGAWIMALIVAAGFGLATHERNRVYQSEYLLWNDNAAHFPSGPEGQYNLGLVLFQNGDMDGARVRFAEAVRLAPDYAQARNNLGLALDRLGLIDEAILQYEEAVRLRPDLVEAQNDLGNDLLHRNRTDEAIAHYRTALGWQPGYALTHCNLGLALTQSGQLDQAVRELGAAVALDPELAEARFDLGNALAGLGRNEEAARCYEAALRLRPDWDDARHNLAVVLSPSQTTDSKP